MMNLRFFFCILMLGLHNIGYGQNTQKDAGIRYAEDYELAAGTEAKALDMSELMQKKFKLSNQQLERVTDINLKYLKNQQAYNALVFSENLPAQITNKKIKDFKVRSLHDKELEMKSVLDEIQFAKYLKFVQKQEIKMVDFSQQSDTGFNPKNRLRNGF